MSIGVPKLSDFSLRFAESEARLENTDATLGAKRAEMQRLNRLLVFGADEAEQAARAERVAKRAAGEKVEPARSVSAQLADVRLEVAELEEAHGYQSNEHNKLRDQEGLKLRESLGPAVAVHEKKIGAAFRRGPLASARKCRRGSQIGRTAKDHRGSERGRRRSWAEVRC